MSLESKGKIEFDSSSGPKVIELLYGDITAMPSTPKADILMISAFHGDYTPTTTSLIGALYRNLSVQVGQLANDKEEDLRRLFHCWWSKPLRDELPFRRILCFESSRSGVAPQKAVQAIFKALVPACSLFAEGVVVSPLLSTGNQNFSELSMLTAIIGNAVVWMKNGLNINHFKLVIFRGSDVILDGFRALKKEHNRLPGSQMRFKSIRPQVPKYDFYLSYVPDEKSDVQKVKDVFLKHKTDLKFFTADDWNGSTTLTQEKIFEVMQTCTRVIAFLSPSYLDDDDRVEEYNAAWCLNRKNGSITRLAPMLCHDISGLPTYMSLIQWVDIRLQNGQTEKLIRNVTLYVVGYIQEFDPDSLQKTANTSAQIKKREVKAMKSSDGEKKGKEKYDVFLSYAHADEAVCKIILEMLQQQVPDVKIFIDRAELRTGGSWQQKLYYALESSKVTIALVSQSYLKSRMCNEEFRLSIARHFTDENFHLLPVHIENMDTGTLPDRYTSIHNMVVGSQDMSSYVNDQLVPVVKQYLLLGKCDGLCFPLNKTTYDLTRLLEDGRCARLDELVAEEPAFDITTMPDSVQIQILSSKEQYDSDIAQEMKMKFFQMFRGTFEQSNKSCNVELSTDYDTATNLRMLDHATLIVVLISASLLKDADMIEELQVAINRQRYDEQTRLYPVLLNSSLSVSLEHYHVYCELLPYEVCLSDVVWENIGIEQLMEGHVNYKDVVDECHLIQKEYENKYEAAFADSEEQDEQRLKRAEKDFNIKRLKFISTACNRIAYHITHAESMANMVLVDTFEVLKEVVLDNESIERQRAAAIEQIAKSYDKKNAPTQSSKEEEKEQRIVDEKAAGKSNEDQGKAQADGNEKEQAVGSDNAQSAGKERIDQLKEKYSKDEKPQASQSCVLL